MTPGFCAEGSQCFLPTFQSRKGSVTVRPFQPWGSSRTWGAGGGFLMSTSVCSGGDTARPLGRTTSGRSAQGWACMYVSMCTRVCACLCMSILRTHMPSGR